MQGKKDRVEMKVISGGNQMSLIRDTEEVLKFLEFAGRKSILNEHAIHNRLTACHNLFGVLNEEEDNLDYILSNLDVLINRFRNKNNNVRASTLKVYKSRVKSSVEDFQSWSADPFAWERAVTDKAKAAVKEKERKPAKAARKAIEVEAEPTEVVIEPTAAPVLTGARRVSFPIRKNFSVEMTLPAEGLSAKELQRIGLFLYPYCQELEPDPSKNPWGF